MTVPIVVSIISPAIKVHYWDEFYRFFKTNNLPWEIVFVGPKKPVHKLASNHRHIRGNWKPAQCLEIAAREAQGEYVMIVPDDVRLHQESMDWSWYWRQHLPPYSVVGVRYQRPHKRVEDNEQALLLPKEILSPITPICGLVKRSEWLELGGLDRQFVSSFADVDLFMRMRQRGGNMFINPNGIAYERDTRDDTGRLAKRFKRIDYRYLIDLWVDDDDGRLTFRKERLEPFQPFDHKTILKGDQGNVRGWK